MPTLITRAEWRTLTPRAQGYVLYMQSDRPESELADLANPYPPESPEYEQFEAGEMFGVLEAQEGDD